MKKKKQGKKMTFGASGKIGNVCPKVPGNFGMTKGKK